uniref:RFX-type winged-helix domain-containing protein n=1 Tax=Parascaris univalens TaxID=6257 RepID=A0A915B3W4_PARUN
MNRVSDADLRTHLSGGEAVETVSGVTAGDAFQQATAATQGGATVTNATYVYTTDYPPYYQYQPLHSPSQPTYIIQQQNSPGSVDEDTSAQLGHTTRAS